MFRYTFMALAIASALMLNGCSQCSNNQPETAPTEEAAPAAPTEEAAPAEGAAPTEAAPAEGAAPTEAAPTEAAPAEGTPAQ